MRNIYVNESSDKHNSIVYDWWNNTECYLETEEGYMVCS